MNVLKHLSMYIATQVFHRFETLDVLLAELLVFGFVVQVAIVFGDRCTCDRWLITRLYRIGHDVNLLALYLVSVAKRFANQVVQLTFELVNHDESSFGFKQQLVLKKKCTIIF